MDRPAVLLVDSSAERLGALSQRLAARGYEVVPSGRLAGGRRLALALESALVVISVDVLAGAADPAELLAELLSPAGRAVVVLGESAEETEAADGVTYLAVDGLPFAEIERRLILLLLGWEIGAKPDSRLEALVGELAEVPLLELVRRLSRAGFSGRVELAAGDLWMADDLVMAAESGAVRGMKAFCRLSRVHEGPFRLLPGALCPERSIFAELGALIITTMEDSLGEAPDLRGRLEVKFGPHFFNATFSPLQQKILAKAQGGASVQATLDELPELDGEILQELSTLEASGTVARRQPQVVIVTDSTCDLSADVARQHGIVVVPLSVTFGRDVYRDRETIQPNEFYRLLAQRSEHPFSSPPPPDSFASRYRHWLELGHEVISLHLSSKLSKTYENAAAAAESVARPPAGAVTVVDSGQVSAALGLLAVFAARMAQKDAAADVICRRLADFAGRLQMLFVVDSLEYLARGGRIGKAQAFLGGLLGIKPILGVTNGEVVPVDRVRGGRAAHPRIIELLAQRVDRQRPVIAAIAHANAPIWADRLRALVREQFEVIETLQTELGPVVGANVGPGLVGVCLFQPTPEEQGWIRADGASPRFSPAAG